MSFLVTGGMGCIGAWTIYHLVEQGEEVICFDLSDDRHRLDLLMSAGQQEKVRFVQGDITDYSQVKNTFEKHNVTEVVHLAALQIPMCRANPVLGARVNVVGTCNIFEAARETGIKHLSYASSIAVYGSPEHYPGNLLGADAPMLPETLYGVYKVANEGTAKIYWQDHGISSTVLRPYTVYGPGRDQGLTSEPTKAMLAAAQGQHYDISFGGKMQFHYAPDVARQFIEATKHPLNGAHGFNMGTPAVDVQEVADIIMALVPGVTITVGEIRLPFPDACDPAPLHTAFSFIYETDLREAIEMTIGHFSQ